MSGNRIRDSIFRGAAMRGRLSFVTAFLVVALGSSLAHAGFVLGSAAHYGILYEGNGNNSLQLNNFNETGNIGIGATGQFQGNTPGTVTGEVDFSAANTGQFSSGGITLVPAAGNPLYNVSDVTSALNTANSLSQTVGLESGTSTTINSGQSVAASSGILDGNGNYVFTVTSISFPNGTFTVTGSASDYAVFNIADGVGNNGLNGSVVLSGGIPSDHVLFNFTPSTTPLATYNADYVSLSNGPTMTISTSGLTTMGVFLDPTGPFQVNHSNVDLGRVIGGDTHNASFVSGANLTAPPVPEPSSLILAALGFAALATWRFRRP